MICPTVECTVEKGDCRYRIINAYEDHFDETNATIGVLGKLLLTAVSDGIGRIAKYKKLNRKMLERPNICYIFEKLVVHGCQT